VLEVLELEVLEVLEVELELVEVELVAMMVAEEEVLVVDWMIEVKLLR